MDGSVDVKLVLQLLGMGVAIIASLVVAKQQIKVLSESVDSLSKKIADLTADIDVLQQKDSATQTSISTFRDILSPSNLEIRAREVEGLKSRTEERLNALRRDCDSLMHMHNNKHPLVESQKPTQTK